MSPPLTPISTLRLANFREERLVPEALAPGSRYKPPPVAKEVTAFSMKASEEAPKAVRWYFGNISKRCLWRAQSRTYEAHWLSSTVLQREIVMLRASEALTKRKGASWRYYLPEITLRAMSDDAGAWVRLLQHFLVDLRDTTVDYPILRNEAFEKLHGGITYDEGIPVSRAARLHNHWHVDLRHVHLAEWITICIRLLDGEPGVLLAPSPRCDNCRKTSGATDTSTGRKVKLRYCTNCSAVSGWPKIGYCSAECSKANYEKHKRICGDPTLQDYTAPITAEPLAPPPPRVSALLHQQELLSKSEPPIFYFVSSTRKQPGKVWEVFEISPRTRDPTQADSLFAIRDQAFRGNRSAQGSLYRYIIGTALDMDPDYARELWIEQFRAEYGLSAKQMDDCEKQQGEFALEGGEGDKVWDELD